MNKRIEWAYDCNSYNNIGISRRIMQWEDGIRTTGSRNSFEWWYFDAEYENGFKIVVIFYTKNRFDVKGEGNPSASIDITLPNGGVICNKTIERRGNSIRASKDKCNVKVDNCFIEYKDNRYKLYYKNDSIEYNCEMEVMAKMYRPNSGHIFFDENKKDYFAWLVAAPKTKAKGTLKINDSVWLLDGTGYHDHNWGNIEMDKFINHWYWCRANIGPYTVIANDIITEKKYGYKRIPSIYIAKDGEVIEDDYNKANIRREDTKIHFASYKFIDNKIIFIQEGKDNIRYEIEFIRDHDIFASSLLNVMGKNRVRLLLARIRKDNPTYLRCVGIVKLKIIEDNNEKVYENEAIWEQMFFGKNVNQTIAE